MKSVSLILATLFLAVFFSVHAAPVQAADTMEVSVKKVSKAKPKVRKRARTAKKPFHAPSERTVAAMPAPAPVAQPYYVPAAPVAAPNPYLSAAPMGNPYLPSQAQAPVYAPAPAPGYVAPAEPPRYAQAPSSHFGFSDLLPAIPEGEAILPRIKKVYPTGEKPLVVVTFKCPTELVGVTPPPTMVLHNLVTGGMNAINATNLLSFNLQQVCQ